jgi:hypothetical protein
VVAAPSRRIELSLRLAFLLFFRVRGGEGSFGGWIWAAGLAETENCAEN